MAVVDVYLGLKQDPLWMTIIVVSLAFVVLNKPVKAWWDYNFGEYKNL